MDILGEVVKTASPIETATQSTVELSIKKIFAVSVAAPRPPFSVTDATRSEADIEAAIARGEKMATVNIDTRLDNRVLDLRTPTNNAIFKLQSAVGTYFREYFLLNDFVEIHSPKIIPGVSEGGANVFKLGYFGGMWVPWFLLELCRCVKRFCSSASAYAAVLPVPVRARTMASRPRSSTGSAAACGGGAGRYTDGP